ncbi:class I SAM-dependent methyltransferase [Kribbella sp. NPDC050470]|uniref:class I SAM-dependent methyltransferase n=1 Tax=unclassified Kribbella TaxID=2644121 RepID=UPI0037B2D42A
MTELAGAPATHTTDALMERLFAAVIDTLEIASIHLGARLGFYRALADGGEATADELATRTGCAGRYVREWLEQQAVAGLLTVDDPDAEPSARRYHLPAAHRPVLVDEDDLNYFAPWAGIAVDTLYPFEQLLDAYRTGAGVPFEAYGPDLVDAIGAANRPQFVNLIGDWLGSIPEVRARLRGTPPARVGDVACGTAQSSIAIAQAFPQVTIDALDIDTTSIERARANIHAARLDGRIRAVLHDAGGPDLGGPFDVVTIFEALHDMNHPVEALRAARASLAPGGSVVIADERVADRFSPPGDEIERANYGFSVVHCLAVGMLDKDSAGTGTVLRPDTVRAYATSAGFARMDVLPIEHDFWRFYRLTS